MFGNSTPFGMSISQENININNSSFIMAHTMNKAYSVNSLIALGSPLVDITVSIDKNTLENYGLEYRGTTYCNEKTQKFFGILPFHF